MSLIDEVRKIRANIKVESVPLMSENHKKFLEHLEESVVGVFHTAKMFIGNGFDVWISGIKKASYHGEWSKYADGGDVYVTKKDGTWARIEIKRLGVEFTDALDWPFRNKFIVCAKHSWDKANPKPTMYIIWSKSLINFALVKTYQFPEWYVESRYDSRYKGEESQQEFYFCPIERVVFGDIISGWESIESLL